MTTAIAVVAFATCSSLMLVINKVTVMLVPAPSTVLIAQLLTASVSIHGMHVAGIIEANKLEKENVKPYLIVAVAFLGALFTNVKVLQHANVETFIVFRSSTPVLIAILDYFFLGRKLPNLRSWLSLCAIIFGATFYMYTDSNFQARAYWWVAAWYLVFCFDQIYIKHVVDTVKLTVWGRAYYTNTLALFPALLCYIFTDEHKILAHYSWNLPAAATLATSCAAGILMSYSSFWLRGLVSATTFTVIGTMCKIATVVINCLIWEKHASLEGLIGLFICLFSGLAYQQAPLRK